MTLTIRDRITRALRGARGLTAGDLAQQLSVPAPSIRRTIGRLRNEGWLITTVRGFYVLQDEELA